MTSTGVLLAAGCSVIVATSGHSGDGGLRGGCEERDANKMMNGLVGDSGGIVVATAAHVDAGSVASAEPAGLGGAARPDVSLGSATPLITSYDCKKR